MMTLEKFAPTLATAMNVGFENVTTAITAQRETAKSDNGRLEARIAGLEGQIRLQGM